MRRRRRGGQPACLGIVDVVWHRRGSDGRVGALHRRQVRQWQRHGHQQQHGGFDDVELVDLRACRRRFRQGLARDVGLQLCQCVAQTTRIVAAPESGHHLLVDDAFGQHIGNGAFKRLERGDAHAPVLHSHHNQQTIAHAGAPQLPGVGHALAVVGDVFGGGAGHQQHANLRAALGLKVGQLLLKRAAVGLAQHARGVGDVGAVSRHRHQRALRGVLRERRQPQRQKKGQAPDAPGPQSRHLPKSTLGGALMAASLATLKLALGL